MVNTEEWKIELKKHKNLILLSLLFFASAAFLTYLTGLYVAKTIGQPVSDLILDHIPVVNLSPIFIYGDIAIIASIFFYPLFYDIKIFHKAVSQLSLLILVRAIFVCFTHLQAPEGAIILDFPWPFSLLDFRNDLFFSGHTAVPFLGFLLFKKVKYFYLAASIIMASTVLLMHVHYSIDVFSAFFITFGTFKIGEIIFKRINHY